MKLIPYIHFEGNAQEALDFYKDILAAELMTISRYEEMPAAVDHDWKNKIMHSSLKFGNNILMISDGPMDYRSLKGNNIQLSLDVEDEAKIDELFNKLAEGGKITMPLATQFWGAKFGMLQDKFGIGWMLNYDIKKEETPSEPTGETLDITV